MNQYHYATYLPDCSFVMMICCSRVLDGVSNPSVEGGFLGSGTTILETRKEENE